MRMKETIVVKYYIQHVDTKVWRGSFRLGGVGVGLKIYTVVDSEKSERTFHIVGMKMMTVTMTTLIISYYYYYYYYHHHHHHHRCRMSIIVPTSIVHPLQGTARFNITATHKPSDTQ